MDDDMAQGEVKVWRGFTLGSLGGIALQLFLGACGLVGFAWAAATIYYGINGRLEGVERLTKETSDAVKQEADVRRREHKDTVDLICQLLVEQHPGSICLNRQRGDAAPPVSLPG